MYITYYNNYEQYSMLSVSRYSEEYKYVQIEIRIIALDNSLVWKQHP